MEGPVRSMAGKGRPERKGRRYLVACKGNTRDTDRTFFRFGPPAAPHAAKFLNFMRLMDETRTALTYHDLYQLSTGYARGEVVVRPDKYGKQCIRPVDNSGVNALCRYGYLRRLAYGRKYDPGTRGRPNAVFTLTELGRESLRRFDGMYELSPYYEDVRRRILDERESTYTGAPRKPFVHTVEPGMDVFNQFWIWAHKDDAYCAKVLGRKWRV